MYFAHSTNDPSKSDWQLLPEHLIGVSEIAAAFGQPLAIEKSTRLAGILHDAGKYTPQFQRRLEGAQAKVDHATAGAELVLSLANGEDRYVAELIAYAIAGHHGGMPDKEGEGEAPLAKRVKRGEAAKLDPAWVREIVPDASGLMPALKPGSKEEQAFQFAFLGRMIFSCLVDADYLETESFYARVERRNVDRTWPALSDIIEGLVARFNAYMADKATKAEATPVNSLRGEILSHVRGRAREPKRLYTLNVPTGGGKTLASLGFALDHARHHGMRRIIYAIPFTSVIDQTAAIFRDVLGEDVVLEHHSAIDEEKEGFEGREGRDKLALAMENWAAPIVVTTNVQLFESLFSNRPSRCRKLHHIAGSVIVLDEAQTLPRPLLAPTARAIEELVRNYACSIVFCTATQPALDAGNFPKDHAMGLPLAGGELAPDPSRLARELKRTTLRHDGEKSDGDLVEALSDTDQGLVIVNSRGHALTLYEQVKEKGLAGLTHLTTRQYAAHRREILESVKRRLKNGQPCRVIATSLVEAGVDFDFPRVWRAEAGLDQIAQAAGRCNREGLRRIKDSIVTVFSCPDHPAPTEISQLTADMRHIAGRHEDLLSPAAIEDFFAEVYWRLGERTDRHEILKCFNMDRTGTSFFYRIAAEKYRMIESGLAPVVVARDKAARGVLGRLRSGDISAGQLARKLQPFIVQVPPAARALLIAAGHVRFERPDVYRDQFAVLLNESLYREDVGLVWEDGGYLGLENSII
ncbi:CRISPR-associated endonuclease Cas3'' [Stappia sp. F7233]|uniref:CRISPR-associated endonuclease Cas3 n=1 Tax=Stappia albiluteola TaxID=2758565 RepID=A0A839AGH0_9HYPH|nr:CRISPR-associated endonuclease Cas3'' [Stappia albiluteola]MBA5778034.1 CRISPR-associated endonuclease Cas3'' [Stappia albiluteola]